MSSVLGVSVGAGVIRIVRPRAGNSAEHFVPDHFDLHQVLVGENPFEQVAGDSIGAALATPEVVATAVAFRHEQHAHSLRAAMARRQLTNYELVPEVPAALQFLRSTGELQGYQTVALYDLGSSGLSVTVVDLADRQVCCSERTSDIGGDYLDSLIREQQIASGRIAHPPTPAGLSALDRLCRQAKEQLSTSPAVALPSEYGLVLISQENFEALITPAVESSARMTRDVITRSERAVQAVVVLGGGARIPLVTKVLERWTGMPVLVPAQPETVVARGAALLARPARPLGSVPAPAPVSAEDSVLSAPAWLTAPPPKRKTADRRPEPAPAGAAESVDGYDPRARRRELSAAGVIVGVLVVVAALGLGLSWGPQVLQGDSQSNKGSATSPPVAVPRPEVVQPSLGPTQADATNVSIAAPPPRSRPGSGTAVPAPGPNTIVVVPGLPPIVVPTLPPVVLPEFPPQHSQR
jgi:hypothetical protein